MDILSISNEDLPIIERNLIETLRFILFTDKIKFDISDKDITSSEDDSPTSVIFEELEEHIEIPHNEPIFISSSHHYDPMAETIPLTEIKELLDLIEKN